MIFFSRLLHSFSAMAYKMSDGIFIPKLQGLADERFPIVISNACSSWREISFDFIFSGARAYIGPIRDVINYEAIDFIKILLTKHLHRPICFGIWRTQREMYADDDFRRPYLLAGPHFTRIKFGKASPTEYLRNRLLKSALARGLEAKTSEEEDIKDNSGRFTRFLADELEGLNEFLKPKNVK